MQRMLSMKKRFYERHGGEAHVFEVFRVLKPASAAPYVVMLDGAYLDSAESRHEAEERIKDAVKWFDWTCVSPLCFG